MNSHEKSQLTPREKECLKWIAGGKTDREISVILKISENTVRSHVNNAMKKLKAVIRTQAVVIADLLLYLSFSVS